MYTHNILQEEESKQLNASSGDMKDILDTGERSESIAINCTKQPLPAKDCRPKK